MSRPWAAAYLWSGEEGRVWGSCPSPCPPPPRWDGTEAREPVCSQAFLQRQGANSPRAAGVAGEGWTGLGQVQQSWFFLSPQATVCLIGVLLLILS